MSKKDKIKIEMTPETIARFVSKPGDFIIIKSVDRNTKKKKKKEEMKNK